MVKKVDEKDCQLVEIGNSYCITLSKNALIAIREGKTFPIEVLDGETKRKIVVMRDTTFKRRIQIFQKTNNQAKESAERTVEANKEVGNLANEITKEG